MRSTLSFGAALLAFAGLAPAVPTGPPPPVSVLKRDWAFINQFLAEVADIFPASIAIEDVSDVIADGEEVLADMFDIQTTQNGLAAGTPCADVTILFARGTTETGNVGALVGPPFFDAVQSRLGGRTLAVQGVDYPASIEGYLNGDAQPGQTMADDITTAFQKCPNTQLVISGYSQGGALVHNAAQDLPASTMGRVSSSVTFGDPDSDKPVAGVAASRTLVICHAGDNICDYGDIILPQHLTYGVNAAQAAEFVISNL